MDSLKEKLDDVSQKLGVDVYKKDGNILELMDQGVLINLHIGRTRFCRKLNSEDIQIDAPSSIDFNDYIQLGQKKIFPSRLLKELDKLERSARNNLVYHSSKTFWGYFVPFSAFPKWKERNDKFQEKYFNMLDGICNTYPEIIEEVKGIYGRLYDKELANRATVSREEFTEMIMTFFPTIERVRSSFIFTHSISYVPLPSLIKKDREELKNYSVLLEDISSRKTEYIDKFLFDVRNKMASAIYDVCTKAGESIRKNDCVVGRTSLALKNLIKQIETINFFNDDEINKTLVLLKDFNTRSTQEVCQSIDKAAESMNNLLNDIRSSLADGLSYVEF